MATHNQIKAFVIFLLFTLNLFAIAKPTVDEPSDSSESVEDDNQTFSENGTHKEL